MGKQILLVEQDQAERERLLSSLRGGGHVVQRVDDVERVSAAAQFASLDLLVMDWAQTEKRVDRYVASVAYQQAYLQPAGHRALAL